MGNNFFENMGGINRLLFFKMISQNRNDFHLFKNFQSYQNDFPKFNQITLICPII